jgi:hypothetical protein
MDSGIDELGDHASFACLHLAHSRQLFALHLAAHRHSHNEIKDREDFRPVAPVVLEEEAGNWFVGADVSPRVCGRR